MFNKQILIYAGLGILVLILIRSIIKSFTGEGDNSGRKNSIAGSITAEVVSEKTEATMSASAYKVLADQLENAMDGLGTNDEAVMNAFSKVITRMDVLKIIQAFGIREDETLNQWLEGDGLSDDVNQLLSERDIDFQF